MTVRELMNELSELLAADPKLGGLPVHTEGCDCIGPAKTVSVTSFHGVRTLLVEREDGK